MRGRDKVDVVAARMLEREHYAGEIGVAGPRPITAVVDFPVLAEDAEQVAVREEDRPRAVFADQRSLFAEVGTVGGDLEGIGAAADTLLARHAVDSTLARAEAALFEQRPERPFATLKLAATLQIEIAWPGVFVGRSARQCRAAMLQAQVSQRHSPGSRNAGLNEISS